MPASFFLFSFSLLSLSLQERRKEEGEEGGQGRDMGLSPLSLYLLQRTGSGLTGSAPGCAFPPVKNRRLTPLHAAHMPALPASMGQGATCPSCGIFFGMAACLCLSCPHPTSYHTHTFYTFSFHYTHPTHRAEGAGFVYFAWRELPPSPRHCRCSCLCLCLYPHLPLTRAPPAPPTARARARHHHRLRRPFCKTLPHSNCHRASTHSNSAFSCTRFPQRRQYTQTTPFRAAFLHLLC